MRTRIRPLQRDELAVVATVLDGLSPASRVRRFHAPVAQLTPSLARALTDVDGHRHVAFVAEVRDRGRRVPVGIARYVREPDGSAELAIAVVDRLQGTGVGTSLLRHLVRHAITHGVRVLHGELLADNVAVQGLLTKVLPATRFTTEGHILRMVSHLDPSPITVEDVMADLVPGSPHQIPGETRPTTRQPDDTRIELTDCAELEAAGDPCLAPAVVSRLDPLDSTSGPVEMVATRCLFGHALRMPASMLTRAG